jgi:hypothetical protein
MAGRASPCHQQQSIDITAEQLLSAQKIAPTANQ